jgi:hypothetical protein
MALHALGTASERHPARWTHSVEGDERGLYFALLLVSVNVFDLQKSRFWPSVRNL